MTGSSEHEASSNRTPVARLWLAVFIGYTALGATIQSLPGYITDVRGGGVVISVLAIGIAFLATAVTRPFAGMLADARDPRPVVVAGGLLTALGGLGHLIAPDLIVLMIARIVMGAGEGALFSASLPWVLRGADTHRRGRVAGWFGLSMWSGLSVGPLVAALIVGPLGYPAVWWLVAGLGATAAALVTSTRSPTPQPGQGAARLLGSGLHNRLLPRAAIAPGMAFGLSSFGYGTIAALAVLFLDGRNAAAASVVLTVFAVVFLLVRTLGSPLVDTYGGDRVGQVAVLIEVLGLVVVAISPTAAVTLLGVALAGAGLALTYPSTVWMTLHRATSDTIGSSVGVMNSFWDLGIMFAGAIGGFVAATLGFPAAFWIAAASGVLSVAVIRLYVARSARVRPGPAT